MLKTDLLSLGVASLRRQKLRTTLTVLGVAIGCAALVVSLACGLGVREAVDAQFRKEDRLRQINVFPSADGLDESTEGVPKEILAIPGEMSEAKRQRIRKQEILRWKRDNRVSTPRPLTVERLEQLRALPHVVSVTPELSERGRMYLEGNSSPGSIHGILPTARHLSKQIEVGTGFSSIDAPEAIVNEYLLYRLGKRSDAEVQACLGTTIRIEMTTARRSGLNLLQLFDGDSSQLTEEEVAILEEAWKQMPVLMLGVKLSAEKKLKLLNVLNRKQPGSKPVEEKRIRAEFKIVGVLRDRETKESPGEELLEGQFASADILLPQESANALFLQMPQRQEMGYSRAKIIVEKETDLSQVVSQVKAMGLNEFSFGLIVQQIRRNVTLIGFAMDFIALVALVVAGVGITNTMFTSVLERTREIGIMKAIGARDRDIMTMFLIEGGLIGLLGGATGVLFGWLAKFPGNRMGLSEMATQSEEPLPETLFAYPLWLIVAVPIFAMTITTLAALLPARRAAKIQPVEALRHE